MGDSRAGGRRAPTTLAAAGIMLLALAAAPAAAPPQGGAAGVRLGGQWVALERGRLPALPAGDGPVHLLVGLAVDAPVGALEELATRGFTPQGRAPGRAWYVRAPRHRVEELLGFPWVEGLALPPPATKLAAPLRMAGGGAGELLAVKILFYPGVTAGEAAALLAPLVRGPLPGLEPATQKMEVTVRRGDLLRLAGEDAVFQIWPAPPPRQVENLNSRDTSDMEIVAATHPGLEGSRVRLGMWDGGKVRDTHIDMVGRVSQMDGATVLNSHATHVAGTMISRGAASPSTLGMAPQARLWAYDFFGDTGEMNLAAPSLDATNHSYGFITGWSFSFGNSGLWHWFGGATSIADAAFGKYDASARDFDQLVALHDLPVFKSAGNDRDDFGPSPGANHYHGTSTAQLFQDTHQSDAAKGGFDTLAYFGVAKNIISVGAVNDVTGDPVEFNPIVMTAFSSWGPADDGRVLPTVVANGFTLFSSWSGSDTGLASASGTSMASPSAAGVLAVLMDQAGRGPRAGIRVGAAEAKGVLVHGAIDAGRPGPDYEFGWGLVNGARSLDILEAEFGSMVRVRRAALTISRPDQAITLHAGTGGSLKATLTWVDPPGAPNTGGNDDPAPALVNDLDLVVTSPTGVSHHPWTLDVANPTAPAARTGPNRVDNTEQVLVDAGAMEAGDWTIRVALNGVLTGGRQEYHLIVTFPCGPDDPDCDGCAQDAVNDADGDGMCAPWDTCPSRYDPLQRDRDDNGVGDACDPGDGLIQGVAFDKATGQLTWEPEAGATAYNVYRKIATAPAVSDAGDCWLAGAPAPGVDAAGNPSAPGEVWLLQLTGLFPGGEGGMGEGRNGGKRQPAAACP